MVSHLAPAYLTLLPPGAHPLTDVFEFLEILARRLGMLKKGGITDQTRAAVWFIKWWREQGSLLSASTPLATTRALTSEAVHTHRRGWGFDFEWSVEQAELETYDSEIIQRKMEECIDKFEAETQQEEDDGEIVSTTQEKKKAREQLLAKRAARSRAKLAARRSSA